MLKKPEMRIPVAAFCIVAAYALGLIAQDGLPAQLPPGITASDLSPQQVQQAEQAARQRGYTPEQIDAAKGRYGINAGMETREDPAQAQEVIKTGFFTEYEEFAGNEGQRSQDATAEKDSSERLPYFGYDVFHNVPDAFKPSAVGPVDPGYTVGPGDVLRLTVWGQVEFQYELTVNNEGKILVPVIGQVHVAGIPFLELQEKLKKLLSKSYSGLMKTPPRTFMDLTVAKLRPVRIFVMGEVRRPGGYTVSSFANVFNALYSIGGPLTRGSLRNVKVIRDGKESARVDLYDYLLGGTSTSDIRLQNNDIIHVPPRGKTVAVTGPVLRPAYYELKENDHLLALIEYAGRIQPHTNIDRAQVYRVLPFEQRKPGMPVIKVIDIDLKKHLEGETEFELFDRDSVAIIRLRSDLGNVVTLNGEVMYPGVYQCEGLSLSKLVFEHGKPIEGAAYLQRADLIRLNADRVTTTTIPVDLQKIHSGTGEDIILLPGDKVIVYNVNVVKPTELRIRVDGEVREPGEYMMSTNMNVSDVLIRAGGLTRKAYRGWVDIFRADSLSEDGFVSEHRIHLPDSLDYTTKVGSGTPLKDRDRLVVRPNPSYTNGEFISIRGQVQFPGIYPIKKRNQRLSESIDLAGGLLPDAFLRGAKLYRDDEEMIVDFSKAYKQRRLNEDVLVADGDEIVVPQRPNMVTVKGEVNNPAAYGYVRGSRVRDYIQRAGGYKDSAQYVLLTHPNGETQKLRKWGLANNVRVEDGSKVLVTKIPSRDAKTENDGPSIGEVIRDTLAIITSAVTILVLASQLK